MNYKNKNREEEGTTHKYKAKQSKGREGKERKERRILVRWREGESEWRNGKQKGTKTKTKRRESREGEHWERKTVKYRNIKKPKIINISNRNCVVTKANSQNEKYPQAQNSKLKWIKNKQ